MLKAKNYVISWKPKIINSSKRKLKINQFLLTLFVVQVVEINGEYLTSHWERARADSSNPNNSMATIFFKLKISLKWQH